MRDKSTVRFYLSLAGGLLLVCLLLVGAGLVVAFAFAYAPWLMWPLSAVAIIWAYRCGQTRKKIRRHFELRGVTIDRIEPLTQNERRQFDAPKNAWGIRYHDDAAVEYRAVALTRNGNVEVLQDVPREVHESIKPQWHEGDGIDPEVFDELANPSDAWKYFCAAVSQALHRGEREIVLSEEQGLPEIVGARTPASFASVVQEVQIASHTAEASGSAEIVADGEAFVVNFTCGGSPGSRTLALTLKPTGQKAGHPV